MPCHLIEFAQSNTLEPANIKESVDNIENLIETDQFDVSIRQCRECKEAYIYCFRQYSPALDKDYYWSFWIPAAKNDLDQIKNSNDLMKDIGNMLIKKSHICWADDGRIYWKEDGLPDMLAKMLFL